MGRETSVDEVGFYFDMASSLERVGKKGTGGESRKKQSAAQCGRELKDAFVQGKRTIKIVLISSAGLSRWVRRREKPDCMEF